MSIDFKERPGFSVNVVFLCVKTVALFSFWNYHFRYLQLSTLETLIYSFVNLICDFILDL